jgi:putative membrane protein
MSEESEPDVRLTLANERTYLAWIRTSLGLIASGIAVERLLPVFEIPGAREFVGLVLVLMGAVGAASSHRRWRQVDSAMRAGGPVPPPTVATAMAIVVALAGVITIALLVWGTKA